jgi:cytochrome c-type biogenesis protein CcmH/NrfF
LALAFTRSTYQARTHTMTLTLFILWTIAVFALGAAAGSAYQSSRRHSAEQEQNLWDAQ